MNQNCFEQTPLLLGYLPSLHAHMGSTWPHIERVVELTVSNYVRATLQPLVHSLVEKPAECSFELDPSKAGANEDIEKNADHLQLMCQALLDLICSSTVRAPVWVFLSSSAILQTGY